MLTTTLSAADADAVSCDDCNRANLFLIESYRYIMLYILNNHEYTYKLIYMCIYMYLFIYMI